MLYLETEYGFIPWRGQRIKEIRYPRSIERIWGADKLASIGLYKPTTTPIDPPEGEYHVKTVVKRVGGIVQQVHYYEPLPNPGPTRTTAPAP